MICEIISSTLARNFLNTVGFDEYVPDGFPVCNSKTLVLGWYEDGWQAMFPCFIEDDCLDMHASIRKELRGKQAVTIGKEAIRWIFENTPHEKVVVYPKVRHGSAYAYLCGFRRNGDRFEVTKWADL